MRNFSGDTLKGAYLIVDAGKSRLDTDPLISEEISKIVLQSFKDGRSR